MSGDISRKNVQIAIDGPVAAGKSTAAKLLSKELGFLYVDTGAMYRAVALKASTECLQWVSEESVVGLMSTLNLELDKPNGAAEKDGRLVTVLLDDRDVSKEIRTGMMGEGASIVSTYAGVREVLVQMQQNIAAGENVVMEGRDIGTRVLPEAQLKIYMDADVETRVERKFEYFKKMGVGQSRDRVAQDLITRDEREMTRYIDPLRPAEGAWVFDTTNLRIEQVVENIVGRLKSDDLI